MALQLSELKLITASNIIALRTQAGLTQAELGAKLNYSDKTISKWERGDAIPDAFVLTELAEIFNITAPTVSYHMNKLVFNGFVESSLEGGKVYYKPNREEIDSFLESVKKFLDSPFTKREKN